MSEFIPYSRQDIDAADIDAVTSALRADFLTQGPRIAEFESAFAALQGCEHGVAVNNATSGLHIACLALGVGLGSRVWTTPNSFVASSNCALYCGATVDFVDIDPASRNMCMRQLEHKLQAAQRAGSLPDVVIPVHFAGFACDMHALSSLANRFGFKVLEDASHATGASFDGAPIGSRFADVSVFSFHAVKIITTGEGGLVTTQSRDIAEQLRLLRTHGITRDTSLYEHPADGPWYYEQHTLGFNCRITDIQAALGLSQLKRLPKWREARTRLADRYDDLLQGLPLRLPPRSDDRVCSWHLYAIELGDGSPANRSTVFEQMRAAAIGVNVHYIPIHLQPYYRRLGFKPGDFPMAERYYQRAISLPLFPALSDQQQERVVEVLKTALTPPRR